MIDFGNGGIKLRNMCSFLSEKLTHSKIDEYLGFASIENKGKKIYQNGFDLNKNDKLYNSLVENYNQTKSVNGIIRFLEIVYDPSRYTNSLNSYEKELEEINRFLIQMGISINNEGKVLCVAKAKTLDEVEERINKLKHEIQLRGLHKKVMEYCNRELLSKDYYHAIFEASKGVFERIRNMTNLSLDGFALIEKVFNQSNPILLIENNYLSNENEKNIYFGNVYLLKYLSKALRNPIAHIPRKNMKDELADCLEILSTISLAHKFLDQCKKWY